jgi:hypothetical protein
MEDAAYLTMNDCQILRVMSGGQSGVDRAAFDWAIEQNNADDRYGSKAVLGELLDQLVGFSGQRRRTRTGTARDRQ